MNPVLAHLFNYAKAHASGVIAAATMTVNDANRGGITQANLLQIALVWLAAFGIVATIPNGVPTPAEALADPTAGAIND